MLITMRKKPVRKARHQTIQNQGKDKTLKGARGKTQRPTAAFPLGAEQTRGQEGHISEAHKDENRLEESD